PQRRRPNCSRAPDRGRPRCAGRPRRTSRNSLAVEFGRHRRPRDDRRKEVTMFVTLNDVRLRVDVQGRGPAIYAHHGAPGLGNHRTPKRAFAPLADAYRIVTFDARGSGASDAVPPYTHAQWVADLDALRAHFGDETLIMKGGSYGGYVALEYTLAHPDRVSALILRDTSASRRFEELAKHNAMARAAEFPAITEELLDKVFSGRVESDEAMRDAYATIAPLYDAKTDPA